LKLSALHRIFFALLLAAAPAFAAQSLILSTTQGAISESKTTLKFTIVLEQAPTANVTVPVSVDDSSEAQVLQGASLTFTNANWSVPQSVVLRGKDDTQRDGSKTVTVTVGPTVSADAASDALSETLSVRNSDNESEGGNHAPSTPFLRTPVEGAHDVSTQSAFTWEYSFDADSDALDFYLCVSSSSSFTSPSCKKVDEDAVVALKESQQRQANSFLLLCLVPLFLAGFFIRTHQNIRLLLVALALLSLTFCGDQKLLDTLKLGPRPSVRSTFSGLHTNTQYYWRVSADDAHGNISSSPIQTFTTGGT
jgi:hypothetical protein